APPRAMRPSRPTSGRTAYVACRPRPLPRQARIACHVTCAVPASGLPALASAEEVRNQRPATVIRWTSLSNWFFLWRLSFLLDRALDAELGRSCNVGRTTG